MSNTPLFSSSYTPPLLLTHSLKMATPKSQTSRFPSSPPCLSLISIPKIKANSPYQKVDLASLTTPQLDQVKKQLDDELEHLTSSFQQLRSAQAKFRECIRSIANGVAGKVEGMSSFLYFGDSERDRG